MLEDNIGYTELQVLYEFITELTGVQSSLIDADELIQNVEKIMKFYCEEEVSIIDHFIYRQSFHLLILNRNELLQSSPNQFYSS